MHFSFDSLFEIPMRVHDLMLISLAQCLALWAPFVKLNLATLSWVILKTARNRALRLGRLDLLS